MIDTHEAKSFRREELNKPRNLMTNQDARLVLSAYRPDGADARDPFCEEALQQAKRDPELMEWFLKQRAFDGMIVAKIRTIQPPGGLNSQIVAGLRAIRVPRHSVSPWFAGFCRGDADRGLQNLSLEGTMGISDLLQAAKRGIASPVCN